MYICCFNIVEGDANYIKFEKNQGVLIDFIFVSEYKKGQQMLANFERFISYR